LDKGLSLIATFAQYQIDTGEDLGAELFCKECALINQQDQQEIDEL